MAHDVFISHSSKDRVVAIAVCAALEAEKIRCWTAPRDIKPGQGWAEAITETIEKSSVMVLIFSSNSNNSKDVLKEITLAVNSGVFVIPLRIEYIEPTGAMKYYLSDLHWLDAINPLTEKQIRELVEIIKPIIETSSPEKSPKAPLVIKPEKKEDKKEPVKPKVSRWRSLTKKQRVGIIVSPIIIAISIFLIINFTIGNSGTNEETIIVTSIADSGPGTLRQALLDAGHGDIITFDPKVFPPTSSMTIALTRGLPEITQGNLTIDASNVGIILDGSKIKESSTNGLTISSNGNIIRGLQIVGFLHNGIFLVNGAQKNMIGGDRSIGSGPLGQGNLLSGNRERGIVLRDKGTSFNTIVGNYIGTDISGTKAWGNGMNGLHMNGASHNKVINNLISGNDGYGIELFSNDTIYNEISGNYIGTDASGKATLGNKADGIAMHEGASYNIIGPDNIIAHNIGSGIRFWKDTLYNTITQNSIHDNGGGMGIDLWDGGNTELTAPVIFDFDLSAGTLSGNTYANCTVEVFSDSNGEGEVYEGWTTADGAGVFTFNKGAPFIGPHLTATVTDADGNTSEFSVPTPARV